MANALIDVGAAVSAGNDARQTEEFNALRIDAGRERLRQQTKSFSEQERRANTEFVFRATSEALQNPRALPGFIQEARTRGIPLPDFDERELMNDPELFDKLFELNQVARGALGGVAGPEFGKQTSGLDPEGNPAFGRLNEGTGQFEIAGGLTPDPKSRFGAGASSATRTFQDLINRLTAEGASPDEINAVRIELGLDPRAGTESSVERIAADPDVTEEVAESQATIAQRTEFAKKTGISRAKLIDKGFNSIKSIDVNLRNLDKAIAAIDEGASTGAIVSRFFPTIRKSTVKLEQIRSELGLDVVGGVTFGALSKGELDLALTVALPVNLQPPELRQWLQDKKTAQEKLRAYYAEQIDFLDQGGSVAGFLRAKERQNQDTSTPETTAPIVIRFDNNGNRIE